MIGFVPARGDHPGFPGKYKEGRRIPLFLRACYNLNQVLPKEDIIVDSDDDEILSLAEEKDFGTLRRPGELCYECNGWKRIFQMGNIQLSGCRHLYTAFAAHAFFIRRHNPEKSGCHLAGI